jgi:hypothetical protein
MSLSLRVASPDSAKTCKQGICVSDSDTVRNGGLLVQIAITHTPNGVPITHYNIRRNGGQDASQGNYAFVAKPEPKQYYSLQACTGGGSLTSRSWGRWVRFYHVTAR